MVCEDFQKVQKLQKSLSLNPSFNGIWSASKDLELYLAKAKAGLNPSFNGIWSARVDSISLYQLIA